MVKPEVTGNVNVLAALRQAISESGRQAISFKDFMQICLYHPEHGYYTGKRTKIGKQGDFYTSSSVGTLMGEMLAQYFVHLFSGVPHQKSYPITEWGGGTGRLAGQILDELRASFPEYYEQVEYTLVEVSPYHRKLLAELEQRHPGKVTIRNEQEWFSRPGLHGEQSIVFSNELLDAFTVHRIIRRGGGYYEIYVGWNEKESKFCEMETQLDNPELLDYIESHGVALLEGQRAEINLEAVRWIAKIGQWFNSGWLITIDYGDTSKELYAPHRMLGSLMCYRQHIAQDNPYQFAGEQDITAHVNFTACIQAGEKVGFSEWRLLKQKDFLIEAGILDKLQGHELTDPFHPIVKKNRAIRQLLLGDRMGDLFKVLIQRKKAAKS